MYGTLSKRRKETPKEVISKKLKKCECIWLQRNNITIMKWKDKRDVLMISSAHRPKMIDVKTKRGTVVRKPQMVADYNNTHMSGIDQSDQMISY